MRAQREGHGNTVITETNTFSDLPRTAQPAKPRMPNTRKKGASDTGKTLSSAKPLLSATTRPRHTKRQAGHTEDKGRETTEMEQTKPAAIRGREPREKATGPVSSHKRAFCLTWLARSHAQSRARPTHAVARWLTKRFGGTSNTVQKVHLVQFCLCQMDILVKQNGQIQILTEKVSE